MASEARPLAWAPQPGPQHALVDCLLPLVLFGGARGGGKTDGVLGNWAGKAEDYGKHFNAIDFRRTTVSFEDAVQRARDILQPLGWSFSMGGNRPQFTSSRGARIAFRYLESIADADEWQGRNLTDACVEEAGQYPSSEPIDRLFGVLRSAHGVPVQLILTANPGGAGQHWIRERFKLHPFSAKPMRMRVKVNEGRIEAAVIPSRIQDNRALLDADPGYIDRLRLAGSKELVSAWLDGDWSAVEGAFFDDFSEKKHVVPPFYIPAEWARFRSMDWGYARPFSVGWWAIASEDLGSIPRGAMIRYREWYGAKKPNVGLRLDVEQVAEGILSRQEPGERIEYTVVDPAMFAQDGGPGLAERMARKGGTSSPRRQHARRSAWCARRLGSDAGADARRRRGAADARGVLDLPGLRADGAGAAARSDAG